MAYPGREDYSIIFEDKSIRHDDTELSQEQRKAFQELEEWIEDVVKGINPPTGKLNECSLSSEPVLPGKGGDYEYLTVQEGLSKATSTISDFFKSLTNTRQPVTFPEGRMTYCSCAYTNCGLPYGHIQHCFYELIADEDAPKVIYCEDRGESDPPKPNTKPPIRTSKI